jgi:hypothetical protein
VGDLLVAVQHRPDEETVTLLPDKILDGFDNGAGEAVDEEARRVRPMLAAQEEVVSQCVESAFLPELADHRERRREALARDRDFLTQGLTGLAAHWNDAALEAFGEGEVELGSELTDRATAAQQCLDDLKDQLERAAEFSAGHLLLTAPEVLGVALVLPTPLEVDIEGEDGPERVLMRRDDEVEEAAMEAVMRYEARQGRYPHDVHVGNSWDGDPLWRHEGRWREEEPGMGQFALSADGTRMAVLTNGDVRYVDVTADPVPNHTLYPVDDYEGRVWNNIYLPLVMRE